MLNKNVFISNFKGILITLVVIGHFMECSTNIINGVMGGYIYKFIYSFHMPAFLFISGYLSKNISKGYNEAVKKYLIPYFFMIIFSALIRIVLFGKSSFDFLQPSFASWFLLTLFYYKIFFAHLIKIKYVFFWSLIAAVLIGCYNGKLAYLSIGRTISFFPFFLLGYYFNQDVIKKIKDLSNRIVLSLVCLYSVGLMLLVNNINGRKFYYFRDSYRIMKLTNIEGIIYHFIAIIIAFAIIIILIRFISEKVTCMTKIGNNSLSIYILHIIPYYLLKGTKILNGDNNFNYILFVIFVLCTIWIFSRDIINKCLTGFFDFTYYRITNNI